ncbi:MAG: cell division protein FtsA [Saprospiraceae bacterium]|nr:cell division protein FtsA [Saprospiraceae bacterium]
MKDSVRRNQNIVVALDIGTTKICALVGRKNELGRIEVMGVGKVISEGVRRGVVANIDKTVSAISDAVDAAEKMANVEIHEVHVGIAGQHIKSLQHQGILTLSDADKEISNEDIRLLLDDMHKLALPPGDKILHIIPQEYTVDDEEGIVDPVGMCGHRLYGNFHVITGQMTAYNNIRKCVEKAGLEVTELTLEPIASAASVLSDEEKEAGVALIDIGGGTTDITIFQEGIIRHTAVVPFGGDVITKDIKEGCTVMHDQAEKLKIRFGSALAEEIFDNRIITIPGLKGRDPKEISEKNLARIIQARLEEIFDLVLWEIKRSGYERKLIAGMVLTGGGALLKNIALLAEYHTGLATRIGLPVERLASGYREEISSPIYATGVGLLIHGIEMMRRTPVTNQVEAQENEGDERDEEKKGSKWLDAIFHKTKELFEATPDAEL